MNLIRRLFPFRTCTIDITEGERALQRPCLLYHIKRCQGPCIEAISKARLPRRHRPGDAVPRGPPGAGRRGAARGDGAALGAARLRARGRAARQGARHRADDGEPEDGRLRADRARRPRARPRRATRRRSSCSRSATARPSAATCSCSRTSARRPTRRRSPSFVKQYYARATSIPPRVLCRSAADDADELEAFLGDAPRRPRCVSTSPQRGEGRELMALADAQRRRDARARAGALAGRPGQDAGRARGAGRRARPARRRRCASSATTSAPSRARTRSAAWSSSRRASRAAASTAASGSGRRRRRRRLRQPPGGAAPPLPPGARGEEGSAEELRWRLPDLVIIDGGKGQVSAAREVLDELGLHDLPLAGLAKEREELFLPGRADPIVLPATSQALYLRPAPARRGAPVRDHVPPRAAREAARRARRSTTCPASGRRGSARCCGSSARPSASARRPVEQIAAVPGIGRSLAERIQATLERLGHRRRQSGRRSRVPVPADMRRMPFPISSSSLIGVLALIVDFFPDLIRSRTATSADRASRADRDASSASTCRAACAASTRRCPGRRQVADRRGHRDDPDDHREPRQPDRRRRADRPDPGQRPHRRRDPGRHEPRSGPPPHRLDRPPRLRARSGDHAPADRSGRQVLDLDHDARRCSAATRSSSAVDSARTRRAASAPSTSRSRARARACSTTSPPSTSTSTSRSSSTASSSRRPGSTRPIPGGNGQITAAASAASRRRSRTTSSRS